VERERIVVIHEAAGPEFSGTVDRAEQERVCSASGLRPHGYLLAVGAVSARKNLGPVLRALAADASLTLALAGPPGHGAAAVEEEIERLGVGARVHRLGYVAAADLPVLVGSARALVHPATFEGFGLPPLEAMAAGTPVVASAGGSLPEVVGDAGLLVPPDDDTAWLDALRRVTGDPDLRTSLVRAGRDRARTFSWQRAAEETAAVHRACLEGGSR
jgi:alpha-1,3-rhamnosyl/mannosyltransferase